MPQLPSTKKTIIQPPDWWTAFQSEADAAGLSLSAWIGEACISAIPARRKTKVANLSARPLASRPKKSS
jgi:hypothetical protein